MYCESPSKELLSRFCSHHACEWCDDTVTNTVNPSRSAPLIIITRRRRNYNLRVLHIQCCVKAALHICLCLLLLLWPLLLVYSFSFGALFFWPSKWTDTHTHPYTPKHYTTSQRSASNYYSRLKNTPPLEERARWCVLKGGVRRERKAKTKERVETKTRGRRRKRLDESSPLYVEKLVITLLLVYMAPSPTDLDDVLWLYIRRRTVVVPVKGWQFTFDSVVVVSFGTRISLPRLRHATPQLSYVEIT